MSKELYVVVQDDMDGSFSPRFTFDRAWVLKAQKLHEEGKLKYDDIPGIDGDGFHYTTLIVPDECTLQSLGIKYDLSDSFSDIVEM
jgi:hypothetical protein